MTNSSNIWIRKALDRLREEFGNCCQKCGIKDKLEFAHINETGLSGRGRGRKERYYNIKNNKKEYLLLCRDCHRETDRGRINGEVQKKDN